MIPKRRFRAPSNVWARGGSLRTIPDDYPHLVERAEGSRFRDVNANVYIDYLCGYGPMIAGYHYEPGGQR